MSDPQEEFSLTYPFVTHDLSVVKFISDRIAIMYLGIIVELAEIEEIFRNPMYPYTQVLLSSIHLPDPIKRGTRILLEEDIPSPANPPRGCRFHTHCQYAMERCPQETPGLVERRSAHYTACFLHEKQAREMDLLLKGSLISSFPPALILWSFPGIEGSFHQ